MWKLGDISITSDNGGQGSVTAIFERPESAESSAISPGIAAAQFSIEGTTLSGIDFELVGTGYRLSLLKRRVTSGEKQTSVFQLLISKAS
jgi:F-BAR domain only protein